MAGLETIGLIAGLVGTAVSAVGTIAAGQQAQDAANFQAKQQEMKANEERAAAQREATVKRHERDFLQSRLQSGAAASGLGALDPTILDLAGDIETQGTLNAAMANFGGESRAAGLRDAAAASRASGKAEAAGSVFSAFGTLASGISGSFRSKYGGTGPSPDPASLDPFKTTNNYYAFG